MRMSESITIDRPISEVFAQWTDVERYPEWADPVIERRKTTTGPVGIGTRFHCVDQWPGRKAEFDMEIVEFEENERFGARWFKPMEGSWTSRLSDTKEGTRLDFEIDMRLPFPMNVLSPLLKVWAGRQNAEFMGAFKQRLETPHHQ